MLTGFGGLVFFYGLMGRAQPARALGGVLPELESPAPDFALEGVVPGDDGQPLPARQGRGPVVHAPSGQEKRPGHRSR